MIEFVGKHKWMFMLALAVIAVVSVVMGCDLGGDCGAVLAMSAAVVPDEGGGKTIVNAPLSTDITREESVNLLERDVSTDIAKVRPNSTPLDAV
ncbi:MAG: hypothetical protein J6L03_09110, partial [Bacteroidaceae bacterium]|nr:hypothetical protein [Bacteroidaceae bacterium]